MHDAPAGVFTPEHGVNVMAPVVPFTEYVPSPGTTKDVAVQFGDVWPAEHSFTLEAVNVTPLAPTTSFERGLIVCVLRTIRWTYLRTLLAVQVAPLLE